MNHIILLATLALLAHARTPLAISQIGAQQSDVLPKEKISIAFTAKVGGLPFSCHETYSDIGLSHSKVKMSDLRFYVSNVELVSTSGEAVPLELDQDGIWQYKNLALLDFEDGTGSCLNGNAGMHKEVTGSVAAGEYTGLRFTLGVPFELDHVDAASAPSPLNMTAMFWSWQSGYKFLRAELTTADSSQKSEDGMSQNMTPDAKGKPRSHGFAMHLGSTGCASESANADPNQECMHPNRPLIVFETFHATTDAVEFDLARLFQGVDVGPEPSGLGGGCMSFPSKDTCVPIMRALGLPFRGAAPVDQVVFRREVGQ
jgi:uncharacterized repeat protein (TIGR04052 family)